LAPRPTVGSAYPVFVAVVHEPAAKRYAPTETLMNFLKSLRLLLSGKKRRSTYPVARTSKCRRLDIEELESRDLPSLTPSGLIAAAGGYDMPSFTWTAVAGTNQYSLRVIDNNTGKAPIVVANIGGSATSYQATSTQALTPGHNFTTYLYAFSTNSQYSLSTQNFALAALAAPTSLSPNTTIPASDGYDTPSFTWNPVAGANHYYLKVLDDNTGKSPIVVSNVNGTSYTTPVTQALTPGHTFTTYVYAYSTNGQAYSFSTQKFVLAALAAPTGITPSATIPASSGYDTPTFTWNAVAGANHYYLKVVDNSLSLARIVIPDVSGTSYTTTVGQALTPGHSFTTYVYAYSTNGQAFKLSTQKFALAALTAPSLTSGPSGTIAASNGYDTPTLMWSNVSGASYYYLRLVDTTVGLVVINNPNLSSTSFTPTAPLTPGHSYTWYVAAKSINGQNSLAFSSQTFNLAALAAPTLTGPSGTISTTSPSFAWNNVSGANHYHLVLMDTTTNVAVINANVSTNSFTPTIPLVLGHSFVWYVAAISTNGQNTPSMSSSTFTLAAAALAAPSLAAGPSGTISTTSPSFSWNNISGANQYYLTLVDITSNTVVINNPNVNTNSFTPATPLTPGHSYTWYVAAKSSEGHSAFSSQSFNLAALAAPSLASGLSGTIAASNDYETPTFTWGAVPGANRYSLRVVDNNTGKLAISAPNLSGTSYTATTAQALMAGHSFTTHVYAFGTNGQVYSLSGQTFALAALAAPTNLYPSAMIPATTGYQTPTFTWSPVAGANHYYLRVMDNNTGLAKIVIQNISGTSYTTTAGQALTPGHSYTTYVSAFGTNTQASSLGTQTFTLGVAPTAKLVAPSTVNEGSAFSVALTNAADTSSAAMAAGFHYAFALDGASLADVTYASASANPSQTFSFTDGLSAHNVTIRILANDGSYKDYTANINVNYVPPTAIIGNPSSGTAGSAVTFTGSATDPSEPDTAAGFQYSWNFGDGTTSTLQSPSHTYTSAGTYAVTLTVTDQTGTSSSTSATLLVTSILDNSSSSGYSWTGPWGFEFDQGYDGNDDYAAAGTGSAIASWTFTELTSGQYEVSATWIPYNNRADNAPYSIFNGSQLIGSALVNQKLTPTGYIDGSGKAWQQLGGPYTITGSTLTVSLSNNADNYVIADAIRIERLVGQTTATIVGLPSSGHSPEWTPLSLSAQFTGEDNGSDQYSWTVTKNGNTVATGCSPTISFTPATAGTYQIAVNVINSQGNIASANATLVADVAPLTVSVSGPPVTLGTASTATAVVSNPGATGVSYIWNFGDGTTATTSAAAVSHVYAAAGTHAITVTATDSEGGQGSATANLIVSPPPLTVSLGITSNALVGSPTAFLANVANQQTGTSLTFSWNFGDSATDTTTTATDSHIYTAAGTFTATVTVTDNLGDQGTASVSVVVAMPTLLAVTLDGTSYALVGSPATFSLSNPNQPPAGGFTYSWSFGDGATTTTTVPTVTHSYSNVGAYTTTVTVTDNQGDQAFSSAPITVDPTSDSSEPLFTPVVNQSDFTYIGSFRLPQSANGWSTAFSTGGLAYRYVNGNLQFFTTSHVYSGGLVYEFNYPGVATSSNPNNLPQAQVITNWGDVYTGQKWVGNDGGTSNLSSGVLTYGLYYDMSSDRLYWNYGDWYNATNPYNPSFGYSTLDDSTGVATGVGAWSLAGRPEKFDRGGILQIPEWFANAYTGGNTLGVGFGGYFSITSTASFGPALAAIAPPDPTTDPDDSSLPNIPLIGYPNGAPDRAHTDTDYTSYYDSGTYPTTPGQWNPANGTGYWSWSDLIYGAGTWIDTPNGQGVLFIAKVGQGNVWYQTSDRHSQSGAFEWMVYNPADLAAVASGAKQQWQIQPEYEWTDSTLPLGNLDQSGWEGDGASQVGGITFDPTTNRLYVLVNAVWQNGVEWYPEMYVYQLGSPATPTANPVVVSDNSAGFSESGTGWSAAPNGFLGEQQQTNNSGPGATATWQTTGLAPGNYTVGASWNIASTGNTSAAVYEIYDGSTLVDTISMNQQDNPMGMVVGGELFQSLACVQINSGTLRVVVTNQSTGTLVADSIDYLAAPVPTFGVNGPGNGITGAVQTFTAMTGNPDLTIPETGYVFDWNFGDSITGIGQTVNHTYSAAGTYSVELTTIAADGTTNYFFWIIVVMAG
jgi:PKD repeat protein